MGPLTEIDFWRRRSRNISGIHEQIKHPVRMNASWVVFVSINFLFVFPHLSLSHFIFFSLSSLHLQLIQFSHFLLSNCLPKFTYTKLLLLLRWVYSTGLMILSSGAREGVGRAGEIQIILLGPILRFIQAD